MSEIAPGCPWYEDLQRFGPANLKWCEERVCGWINEPANAWSNLSYLAAGVWIVADARRRGSRPGQAFGAAVFAMGAFSFYYHSTNNFLTQVGDFLGMYLMTFMILATNARRLGAPRAALLPAYLVATAAATAALWPLNASGFPIQWTIAIIGAAIVATELAARRREAAAGPLRWFWIALGFIVAGEAFSLLDLKRVWCDPGDHFLQGHAVWHLLGGFGMAAVYRHYQAEFDRAWA